MRHDQGGLFGAVEKVEIMSDSYNILHTLLRTEKGTVQVKDNKYFFSVRKDANKIQIKKAVEDVYKVKVQSVNTQVVPGKNKRVRHQLGRTAEWKKAVVTLKDGQKIDLA
jgi:large subunit ribosomal protein L23